MMKRQEKVEKVKRELFTEFEENPKEDEDPIDENFNSTPRKKKLTNPRKCLLKRFRIPHESDTDDENSERPKKRIKIEQIDLHEIQENSKYYISQDKSVNESIMEESTNDNGDDDNNNHSQGVDDLQMKRMIYSQFSESGKKYLTSFSDWRLTQEDKQLVYNDENNAACTPTQCDYAQAAASPIVLKKSANHGNHKLLMKNSVYRDNEKVEKPFFSIPKKSINNSKERDLLNRILKEIQKSSDANVAAITNQFLKNINSEELSRPTDCFIENNYFDKENECQNSRRNIFNGNHNYNPLFEVSGDKKRRILGKIDFPLIEINSDVSEIDSTASTQIISQNNDNGSLSGESTQPLDQTQFSLPDNSSEKILNDLNSNEISNEDLTQINTQSVISLSPLPTENSEDNPWLNVTSQDFSQTDHNYSCKSTQDSGKATQDTIASDFSFLTMSSSNSPEINTGSLQDLFHTRMATIRRTIALILSGLEKGGSQSE